MSSEKKIKVPELMLEAFFDEAHDGPRWNREEVTDMLAAALRWLSENPMTPDTKEARALMDDAHRHGAMPIHKWGSDDYATFYASEWQRRMFLAPEEEDFSEIRDLMWLDHPASRHNLSSDYINDQLKEAYRRGREGR